MILRLPCSTPLPYTTLFRSQRRAAIVASVSGSGPAPTTGRDATNAGISVRPTVRTAGADRSYLNGSAAPSSRSEEHTSELQSRENLVCRLLLEKKNIQTSSA